MPYIIRRVNLALLLSIFLSSCLGHARFGKEQSVSATLTSTSTQTIFYLDTSALSYGIYETEATSVTIDIDNTLPAESTAFADISVEDGSGITTYKVQPGESSITYSMPLGKKHVTITSGGQTKFNTKITGVFIHKITFNRSAVQIKQANKRVVIYGDSITVGGKVDHPSTEAWPVLLRKHYSVIVDAYSYRALYDDASTSAKRSELVSKISLWMPDYVWLAIGANDYAFGQWSAQEFGKAYAATLDAIHLSNSRALVFAQSPILRANEGRNSFGDDLENYRQQIATACLARGPWCIFVDGKNSEFPQPNELDKDGIHLTTKSSAKYAEAVRSVIDSIKR